MEKAVTHTAVTVVTVFSYLFHFFRLKGKQIHVPQINLVSSKTPLIKVTFW